MDTVIPILIGLVALACACFSKAIANQRTRAHFSQTELESTEAAMQRRVRRFRRGARMANVLGGGGIAALILVSLLH